MRKSTISLLVVLAVASQAIASAAATASTALPGVDLFRVHEGPSEGGGIAAGPDGNVWYTERAGRAIGRITPGGISTEFPLRLGEFGRPGRLTSGPDGNLWVVTGDSAGAFARVSPAGEQTGLFGPAPDGGDIDIVAGADRNLWFTELAGNRIGRLGTDGQVAEFPVPPPSHGPIAITAGVEGNPWFALEGASAVGRITPAGVISEFPLSPSREGPRGIAAGHEGSLWVSEFGLGRIARVRTDGSFTEFQLPVEAFGPGRVVVDGRGDVWFLSGFNSIWRLSRDGAVTRFNLERIETGDCRSTPCQIQLVDLTIGPEGAVWFISGPGSPGTTVGRIDPRRPPPAPVSETPPSLHGAAAVGAEILARTGSWSADPGELTYRWKRCSRRGGACETIKGARDASLELTPDDLGSRVRAEVAAVDRSGTTFVTTAATAPVRRGEPVLELPRQFLHVDPKGRVAVPFACFGGTRGRGCGGRLSIANASRRGGPLGHVRYRLGSGRRESIRVPLLAAVARRFARAPRRRITVRVSASVTGGTRVTRLGSLTGLVPETPR